MPHTSFLFPGTVFKYNGKIYKVEKAHDFCHGCAFASEDGLTCQNLELPFCIGTGQGENTIFVEQHSGHTHDQ